MKICVPPYRSHDTIQPKLGSILTVSHSIVFSYNTQRHNIHWPSRGIYVHDKWCLCFTTPSDTDRLNPIWIGRCCMTCRCKYIFMQTFNKKQSCFHKFSFHREKKIDFTEEELRTGRRLSRSASRKASVRAAGQNLWTWAETLNLGRNFEPGQKLWTWAETLNLGRNFGPGQNILTWAETLNLGRIF
jgi:hypothetical protein